MPLPYVNVQTGAHGAYNASIIDFWNLTFGLVLVLPDLRKLRFVRCAVNRRVNLLVPWTGYFPHLLVVLWLRGTSPSKLFVLRYFLTKLSNVLTSLLVADAKHVKGGDRFC
jgi:hypothetical protein